MDSDDDLDVFQKQPPRGPHQTTTQDPFTNHASPYDSFEQSQSYGARGPQANSYAYDGDRDVEARGGAGYDDYDPYL